MSELDIFVNKIKEISSSSELNVESAREIVKEINEFLFTTHENIGTINALGREYDYFSDFHKYWDENYKEILSVSINDLQCEKVAITLHDIYLRTNGAAFKQIYDKCGLTDEQVCRVRFLTANQDFRGSRSFEDLASKYNDDPSIFDIENIYNDPTSFIRDIGITQLSQNDKRISYAKTIAKYIIDKKIASPYDLIKHFDYDILEIKNDILNCQGSGYGNKKTDMFLRDMVVLGIWKNVKNFDCINVASDVNTIKVALRTGILQTAIPLVSSFLDIFGNQYSYIDEMSSFAWRRVWEKWKDIFPTEVVSSPCLLDYLIYNVIGREMCKEKLVLYECDEFGHKFFWHTSQNKTCQICYKNGLKKKAHVIKKMLPCDSDEALPYIKQTNFYKSEICKPNIENCPFKEICNNFNKKNLQPPKSISIEGATGWSSAYANKNDGGGGLMS